MLQRRSVVLAMFSCLLAFPAFGQGSDPFANPFGNNTTDPPQGSTRPIQRSPAQRSAAQQSVPKQKGSSTKLQGDAEKRIEQGLQSETSITFIETPLSDAMQRISEMHQLPVVIDTRALEEIGLDGDHPVTIDLRNVMLRSALRLMLRDCDLTYMIKDEVLQITTREAAESSLILKMYTLDGKLGERGELVVTAITRSISPDVWESLGGPGTVMNIDHVLIVATTSDVHVEVNSFLSELAAKYDSK